jgi:DNA-binding NarL/FixJ family response regulator
VLVVDDDSAFRDLAARVLSAWGHVVVGEAGTVAEALERAEELRPEAALVDVGLPDGDGFALARRLTQLPWPVRIVLISSDTDRAAVRAARDAGARGFLAKDDLAGPTLRHLLEGA